MSASVPGAAHRGKRRGETDINCYALTRWSRVEEITSAAWLQARRELHNRAGGPLGSRSIAHLANTLRQFLRYCHELRIIQTVPEIKSPSTKDQRAEQAPRSAMSADQRDAFLRALRKLGEDRAHRVYTTLFWSLLRQNEAGALTKRWIDWTAPKITLPAEHTKSGEVEEIDPHPKVRRALRAKIAEREKMLKRDLGPDEPIFGRFDYH